MTHTSHQCTIWLWAQSTQYSWIYFSLHLYSSIYYSSLLGADTLYLYCKIRKKAGRFLKVLCLALNADDRRTVNKLRTPTPSSGVLHTFSEDNETQWLSSIYPWDRYNFLLLSTQFVLDLQRRSPVLRLSGLVMSYSHYQIVGSSG
jgi:hypothetical protein